jgi:hypothetical protein
MERSNNKRAASFVLATEPLRICDQPALQFNVSRSPYGEKPFTVHLNLSNYPKTPVVLM